VMGLALFTLAGLAGAVLYIIHHIVVKTTLFLTAGLVELRAGSGRLARIGGLAHRAPVIAVLFLLPALSLAGLPPFSGFVAKLALVEAGMDTGAYVIVGVSLAVSLLTLFSMTKIWANAFWGEPVAAASLSAATASTPAPRLMVAATTALAALSVAIAVAAGPLYRLSERAAADLLDPTAYIDAVLQR
jgi:multicomponent Na+:H+ antiporter subunit D